MRTRAICVDIMDSDVLLDLTDFRLQDYHKSETEVFFLQIRGCQVRDRPDQNLMSSLTLSSNG